MKQYSSIRSVQILAHVLKAYGVEHFVISPGSRNAPMAIHFSETDEFNCYSIVDERSAGFVALGMARSLQKPVALVCTSGSAVANYYPAVTEAFYQNTPLLLLTADRPKQMLDLFDGQTIRQNNFFAQHSFGDFELKEDNEADAESFNFEQIKKAVEICFEKKAPVHINIPLNEPLYELTSELPLFPPIEQSESKKTPSIASQFVAEWNTSKRIMILVGTQTPNEELEMLLSQLVKNHSAVILTETNANLQNEKFFAHIDRYIFDFDEEKMRTYAPDLLITIGQNIVSKKVKQFLRQAKPQSHWHIDEVWHPDTYFALTEAVQMNPIQFLRELIPQIKLEPQAFYNLWDVLRDKKDTKHQDFLSTLSYSDFATFNLLSNIVPEDYQIHFGNSSVIRYAQLFNFQKHKTFCNRGTSGIEGSTSTAMGYAMVSEKPTLLITGDMSFFYDINGLWNQYIPPYTRIIVINNGGGNIFKFIPGPSKATNSIDEFIATTHENNVEHLAKHFGLDYINVSDEMTLDRVLEHFFKPHPKAKILEIDTQKIDNAKILKDYFAFLKP
ncbi:MAG: 2-succinyl-5-enolpyruvyl-6-hydroxy-3-cyclohexene-1-carboxylic-acid synthase [Flavobacteriales bacterium]|nr:MAG: 2-succinyl-5-enolpyruvyl-6-hydroxy-3-cyclohexene-1-carboxylic-acid synthase [Flavobacteriales bacterium]